MPYITITVLARTAVGQTVDAMMDTTPVRVTLLNEQAFRVEPDDVYATVREPGEWFDAVAVMLFGALKRHDPHLFDALRALDGPRHRH